MNTSKIILPLLVLSLGCNIFWLTRTEQSAPKRFNIRRDSVSLKQSAPCACKPNQQKIVSKCPEDAAKTSKVDDAEFKTPTMEDYEKFQQKWSEKSSEFLEYQLRLPLEKLAELAVLRQERSQEMDELLSSKFKQQIEENGEDTPLMLGAEDTISLGKLNLKYEKRLLDLLGDENMREYQYFKQSFNQAHADSHQFVEF